MTKRTNRLGVERRGNSRSRAAVLLALLALVVLFALWPRKRPIAKKDVAADEPVAATVAPPAPMPAPPPPDVPRPGRPAPVIDEVLVEKPEVCEGEENLITVRAHTEDGTDEYLHYIIDGRKGPSVPVRLMRENGQIVGRHGIVVFGRDNVATTVPLPAYKVKDCRPTYLAEIGVDGQPNSWSEYDFVAKIAPYPSPRGTPRATSTHNPVGFEWSFGDGESATTTVPTVSHSYEGRAQDSSYSYMAVKVKIRMDDGTIAQARTSLALTNPAFESLAQKGVIQLLISLEPRFPELGDDGRVVQHVRVWHTAHEPVQIEAAALTKYFSRGNGESVPRPVNPAAVLGTTTIPPGKQGVTATVVLDTGAEPDVFSATYRLSGRSASGTPVAGSFSVMRPPRHPTRENNKPVNDPVFKAKILAAREMLGKEFVTDTDIASLDRQGRFAKLDVAPATAGPAAPGPGSGPGPANGPSGAVPALAPPEGATTDLTAPTPSPDSK